MQPDGVEIRSIPIEEARALLQREGIDPTPTTRVVSALVEAFASRTARRVSPRPYHLRPASLGSVRPGVDMDKALALADALDDEQLIDKFEPPQ